MYLPLTLKGALDKTALQAALNDLMVRHETLRTTFAATDKDPVQVIAARAELPLEFVAMPDATDAEIGAALIERERLPFDLNNGPLIRATLLEHSAEKHSLLIVIHHIVSDGWSFNVLQRELGEAYAARRLGRPPAFTDLPIQYADFASWQRAWLAGDELSRQLTYWRDNLAGAPPVLELPLDRPRPEVQSTSGEIAELVLDAKLSERLKNIGNTYRTTLFMTMLAGLKVLFSRLSGQDDILIGAPIAGRNRLETEGLIGFFVNALVMRTDLSGDASFAEVLGRVRRTTLEAYAHQDIPFELIVSELQPDRDTRYSPLFQVAFSVETAAPAPLGFDNLDVSYAPGDAGTTTHDMVFLLWDIDGQVRGSVRYNTDLFNADTIERLLEQYTRVLEAVCDNPNQAIRELPLATDAELEQMLVTWNQTDTDFPSNTTIHWLFEQQAQQTPDNNAVECGETQLTYAELDSKANQLAHYLINSGVGRDDCVGLCVDRSPNMIIGILGIMKAGGAYVPMDPAYPRERLEYIARDCAAKLLLTEPGSDISFAPADMQTLCLTTDWDKVSRLPITSPNAACGPGNLAYVIYTSGSTGQPKGVMVEHRGACNLATAQIKLFNVKPDSRVLQFASFSFDASFSEIAMSLLSGATLVLADRDDLLPGDPLLRTLGDKAITTVTLTPTVLVNTRLTELPALDTIVTAGEACPPSVVAGWGNRYRLINAYGPTEASVCVSAGVCTADDTAPAIGKPIANVQVYLLDDRLRPVPLGATGELCVGGVGVTRGYLNRPDLTAEKFISDPFSDDENARLYRTGDLARYRPDGNIDYIGRIDQQVKVRGFRIEPGEIEASLVANPDVREALVIADGKDVRNQQLVAYVVPETAQRELELWPSVAEFYVYDEALYYAMTHDERRNAAYVEAIKQAVPGKVVLDIGTGQDAILARLCVAEGAAKVYAIELLEESYIKAKATIKRHGLEDKIILIHGNSFEVELPELVDVCVSELVGAIGGSEGVAKIINDAHRYLKPDGRMIPELSETLIAAVTLPDRFLERPGFTRATANYTQKIFDQVGYPFDLRLCVKGLDYNDIISDTDMFERLDHRGQVPLEEVTPLKLSIAADSRIDGFLVWLTLTTAEGCTLIDSLRHEHCWLPVYLPVFDPGVAVSKGDRIEAHIARTLCDNDLNPDFRVYGRLIRQAGDDIEFDYDCFHYKEQFRAAPFYARLFAGDEIPVAQSAAAAISAGTLRTYLQDHLPEHMIPASFVALNQFPLTPNGKIDRKALPAPGSHRLATDSAYVAPSTTAEQLLARIWSDFLGTDRIGVDDNFFELGGDSILSIQIIARAASKGLHFTPKQLFKHQTIRNLAAAVSGQAASEILAEQGLVTGPVVQTAIQRWFLEAEFKNLHHFNQGLLYESDAALDAAVLERAFGAIIMQHDALRLRLKGGPAGWEQEILPDYSHAIVEEVDLAELDEAAQLSAMERLADKVHAKLNPLQGINVRALLCKRGAGRPDQLLIVIHHLAVDWVSWPIIIEDLALAYQTIGAGGDLLLPPKTTSFQQWAERIADYAKSAAITREADYWTTVDWGQAPALPVDMQAAENVEASLASVTISLDTDQTSMFLTSAPAAYHTQANDLLLSAITLALTDWCESQAMLIDMEGHGREDLFDDIDLSRTVGWFTSLYPVLLAPDAERTPGGTIKAVKEQLRNIPQRGIGFGLLRYMGAGLRSINALEQIPAPEIGFNYLGQTDRQTGSDGLLRPAIGPTGRQHSSLAARPHLLDITGSVSGGKLYLTVDYSNKLHHAETIEKLAANILHSLGSLLEHCASAEAGGYTPSDFPLAKLAQAELDRLLADQESVEEIYALTPLQEGMLFHSEFGEKSDAYFTQFAGDLIGAVDAACLRDSWQHVIDRHDVLRSSLHWQGLDHAVQIVHKDVRFTLTEDNWSHISATEIDQHFAQLMRLERDKGFDLDQPKLNRVHLIKTGPERFRLLWSFHHALLDGWSIPLVLNELLAVYHDLSEHRTVSEQPANGFKEYIEWLSVQDPHEAERFWCDRLAGFSEPTPLPGVDRAMALDPESAEYEEEYTTLPEDLGNLVRTVAQRERLTANTLVQAAWALVLARYTRSDDIVYGATTSGRPATLAGVETMVGQFLNTLPVRVQLDSDARVIDWLREFQEEQLSMRSYEYAALIDMQSWSDVPRGQQLFETLFAYENYPQMKWVESPEETDAVILKADSIAVVERTNYPLTFTAVVHDSVMTRIIYDTRAYDAAMIKQLLAHFAAVLRCIAENPGMQVGDVTLIDAAEQARIRSDWNQTAEAYPTHVTLQGLFELQVARSPDATALVFEDQQLSYAELNARANQLAHLLRDRGVGTESLVGVCMERSIEMVVALYGILKAGGAYVPLDPDYPEQRLRHMCEDANVELVLCQEATKGSLSDFKVSEIALDSEWQLAEAYAKSNLTEVAEPDNAAYVIFTSGSTGRPKGVVNEHRGICNRLLWMQSEYGLTPQDRVLQKTPYSFDVSVWEFFWPLQTGARLVIAKPDGHKDPDYLAELIQQQGITTLHFVPSMLDAFLQCAAAKQCTSVVRSICSGEELTADLRSRYFATLDAELHNLYGPTEAAIDVSSWACSPTDNDPSVPIGRPVANTSLYIVDENGRQVPPGVPGELWIGGIQVARGYVNRPDLTAERFIPDPFCDAADARAYRTGDLVKYRADGVIEFLGRIDFQIKLRGYRIELGEIEAEIKTLSAVDQAAVILREDIPGDPRIVAYVVGTAETDTIRNFLSTELPDYMIPSAFVALPELPLTVSGKLDRNALPAPDWSEALRAEYIAPRTPTETALAEIWQELLGVEQVGVNDDFFQLGGHSIIAMKLASRIVAALETPIAVGAVFATPTVAGLAAKLEAATEAGATDTAAAPIGRSSRRDRKQP
jgi:amino acid adenylation domain-containing protein/non-ribosomal peptide synthase protein (TIGR01720 family)